MPPPAPTSAGAGFTAGLAAKQATRWPGARVVSAGRWLAQISIASGQRGWKRQPGGGAARFGGAPRSPVRCVGVADPRQALDQVLV